MFEGLQQVDMAAAGGREESSSKQAVERAVKGQVMIAVESGILNHVNGFTFFKELRLLYRKLDYRSWSE